MHRLRRKEDQETDVGENVACLRHARAGSPRLLAYTSSCAKLRQWQAIRPTLLALSCNSVLVHVLLQQLDMLYLIAFDGYMGYCIGHFRRHIWCNLFANVPRFLQSVQRTLHDICHHYIISQNSLFAYMLPRKQHHQQICIKWPKIHRSLLKKASKVARKW